MKSFESADKTSKDNDADKSGTDTNADSTNLKSTEETKQAYRTVLHF